MREPSRSAQTLPNRREYEGTEGHRTPQRKNHMCLETKPSKRLRKGMGWTQNPPGFGPWGFDSPSRHQRPAQSTMAACEIRDGRRLSRDGAAAVLFVVHPAAVCCQKFSIVQM